MEERKHKKNFGRKILKVVAVIMAMLILEVLLTATVSAIGNAGNLKFIESRKVVAVENPLSPPEEDAGYYAFTCDRDFRILQLTDVHIGGGAYSLKKDGWAINAVYDLVSFTKPDLIIVTGDIAYPIPFQAGTLNNLHAAKLFAELMERTGIFWAFCYGNHDTEAYSFYDRKQLSEFYGRYSFAKDKTKHCLFQTGPENVDGCGNYIINVKNSSGAITQSLIMFDSHSYRSGFGYNYDNIHQNQVDWYASEIDRLNEINKERGASDVKSLAFFHIPLTEYRDAYKEYYDNDKSSTDNVEYIYGNKGEPPKLYKKQETYGIWCGTGEDELFETMLKKGSTQGIFAGHDHLNNFSLYYNGGSGDKTIRLTYGMSIDYLAYVGIWKKTAQRGGTIITVKSDGSFDCRGIRLVDKKNIE